MKKYIIGIDGGSQSTKVVMYDLRGNVVLKARLITADAHARCRYCRTSWRRFIGASLCFAGHDLMSQFAVKKIMSVLVWDPSIAAVRY